MTKRIYSALISSLNCGKFTFTGELEPKKTTDLADIIQTASFLKNSVVACNVTDNPQSFGYISSLVASYLIQKESKMETIYQLTCRDRNRLALLSDLLGAGALGIKNVLALTGDHTTLGDTPQSKPVFDLDSTQLIQMVRKMVDEGVDLNGKIIVQPPKLHVGGVANPNANPLEPELNKIEKKVAVGAEFIQSQVVFEIEKVKDFLNEMKGCSVPIIIGIMPLKSYGVAKYFDKLVPGVHVPKDLMTEIAKAKEITNRQKRKKKYMEINLDYFVNFIKELKSNTSAAGCHIMSVGYEEIVPRLVKSIT